jgi:hypothetical protein
MPLFDTLEELGEFVVVVVYFWWVGKMSRRGREVPGGQTRLEVS